MTKSPEKEPKSSFDGRTTTWSITTYFAEGLPFMIVRFMSSVFFTDIGMREAHLGFLNFLGIPWNLKFLWAPVLDIFGTKKGWLIKVQFLIGIFVFLIAILASMMPEDKESILFGISFLNKEGISFLIVLLFVALAFLSATHDVAIDAYYLEALPSEREQSLYSGIRVMAYRVAIIYSKSFLVIMAGVSGWFWGFGVGALTMLALFFFHLVYLKPTEKKDHGINGNKKEKLKKSLLVYLDAFRSYMAQDKAILVLVFIIMYKLGDEIMFSMNTPFLLREIGMTKAQLGWVSGIVGTICAIGGSLWGGKWISSWGLKRAIWPMTIIMNITILAYALLAWVKPDPMTNSGLALITFINGYEQIAAGLGTAVLIVFLMNKCQADYKASHYAIGSAIMSLGGTIMGGFGGVFVEQFGYMNLFLFGFLASVPSMVMIFWVPLGRVDGSST